MLQKFFLIMLFVMGLFILPANAEAFASYEKYPIQAGDTVSTIAHTHVKRGGNEWREKYVIVARPLADGSLRILPKSQAHRVFVGDVVMILRSKVKTTRSETPLQSVEQNSATPQLQNSAAEDTVADPSATVGTPEAESSETSDRNAPQSTMVSKAASASVEGPLNLTTTSETDGARVTDDSGRNETSPNNGNLDPPGRVDHTKTINFILLLFITLIIAIILIRYLFSVDQSQDYADLADRFNEAARDHFNRGRPFLVEVSGKPLSFDVIPQKGAIHIKAQGLDHGDVQRFVHSMFQKLGLVASASRLTAGAGDSDSYDGEWKIISPKRFHLNGTASLNINQRKAVMQHYANTLCDALVEPFRAGTDCSYGVEPESRIIQLEFSSKNNGCHYFGMLNNVNNIKQDVEEVIGNLGDARYSCIKVESIEDGKTTKVLVKFLEEVTNGKQRVNGRRN